MKKFKVLILIFMTMITTTAFFTGCGDKFKDLSAVLDKDSVVLYLDDETESNTDTVTLSLNGLYGDSSAEIEKNITNNICDIDIKTDNETKESKITFTAISGGNAVAQFIHKDSNKILASVSISVVKKVKSIAQNMTNDAIVVSGVGTKVVLSTSKIIEFTDPDTTQKDVVYKLKDNIAGVEVSENGVITFNEIPTAKTITLTATVKDTQVSTDVTLKILNQLTIENFKPQYTFDTDFEDVDMVNGIRLINNRSSFKAVDIKIGLEKVINEDIKIEMQSMDTSICATAPNEDTFTLVTGNKKGETSIKVTAYIDGYKDITSFDFFIPVYSIKVPDTIKVNGDYEKILDYDIFDVYSNNLGQLFEIVLGDEDSNDLTYALLIEQDSNNLIVTDEKGVNLQISTDKDELIPLNNQLVYIKANQNFSKNSTVKAQVIALGSYGYDSKNKEVVTTINLKLRKGVEEIEFENAGNIDIKDTTYYVPMNNTRNITFSIANDSYSNKFMVSSTGKLDFDTTIINDNQTKFTFGVSGNQIGNTTLTVTAQNGISNTIIVKVFYELEHFAITTDSYLDNADIGLTTYKDVLDNNDNDTGIQTLSHLAIKESKSLQLYIGKYDKDGLITPSAELFDIQYSTSDNTKINVTRQGILYSRSVTNENDSVKVSLVVSYYSKQGVIKSQPIEFDCEVFRAVNSLSITNDNGVVNSILLYYKSGGGLLYHYKDYMQQTLSIRLNPVSATHITNVKWEFDGDINTEIVNNKATISARQIVGSKTVTGMVRVTQFNKTYIKRFPISIYNVEEITNFNNISYSINNGENQKLIGGSLTNLGEMNIDFRDIVPYSQQYKDSASTININYSYSPLSATFNDVIFYYQEDKQDVDASILIDENNGKTLYATKSGTGRLYLIPKTKFTVDANITSEILDFAYYITIVVADGLTEETAFNLSRVEDILKMNNEESLSAFRYYKLVNDIDMSRVVDFASIGSNSTFGFRGQVDGQGHKIKGINLNKTLTGETEYGLFSRLTGTSVIKNIDFEVQNMNVLVETSASTTNANCYVGGVVAFLGETSRLEKVNVNIKNANITFDNKNGIVLNFGGLVGQNEGVINSSTVVGNINVDLSSTASVVSNIGGLVGVNNGQVIGNYTSRAGTLGNETLETIYSSQDYIINSTIDINVVNLSSTTSSFGGIVATNNGVMSGLTSQSIISVQNKENTTNSTNLGGVVGTNATNGRINDCLSILTNKQRNESNLYKSALTGYDNIGGLVGYNDNGNISNCVVMVMDISDFYDDTAVLQPVVSGNNNVGGIVGYANGGSLTTSYIKSYFIYTKNGQDRVVNTISSNSNGGAISGNSFATSNCYADNVCVNNEIVNTAKNNNLIVLEQPTTITATIDSVYKINDSLALLQYNNNGGSIYNVVTISTSSTTNGFINGFVTNNKLSYDFKSNSILVYDTGKSSIRYTSLLNNSLIVNIDFEIIDNVSQYGFANDVYKTNEITKNIAIKSNNSKNIYLNLKTSVDGSDVDYLLKDTETQSQYKCTVDNLKLKFTTSDADLFTINGASWDNKSTIISILDRISIVAKENVSGVATLTIDLMIDVGGQTKIINTIEYNVEVYYGITDMHISSNNASISKKDSIELELVVDSDNNNINKDDIEISYQLVDNNGNALQDGTERYVNVNINEKASANNSISYIASISIDDSYQNDKEIDYTIKFTAKYDENNVNNKENQIKDVLFNLTLQRQKVENINLSYFANAERNDSGEFTINEVPTTIAYPGNRGVLKVNVYPKEAIVSQVEVTYATSSTYALQLSQLLFNKEQGAYQSIYPNAVNISNGIRFTKNYAYFTVKNNEAEIDETYDGNLFVGVGISGQCPEGVVFTISVKITTNDGRSFSKNITLTTTTKPSITIVPGDIQNQDGVNYVANNVEYNFEVNYTKIVDNSNQLDTIKFKVNNTELNRSENNGIITYSNQNVAITQNTITQTGQGSYVVGYTIKIMSNGVYNIETSFTKSINNIESVYNSNAPIKFSVQNYVIRSINVQQADGNVFRIALGQTRELKVGLNVEYDETNASTSNTVLNLNDIYSKTKGIWYYTRNGNAQILGSYNDDDNINEAHYFAWEYDETDSLKIIAKNRDVNGNKMLSVGFYISYNNGAPAIYFADNTTNAYNKYNDIQQNPENYINISYDFELNIYDTSGPNNYVPIGTLEELLSDDVVQPSGYYRLTNNIIVNQPWTPLTKQIKVLDGNGYSIILTQGFSEDYFYTTDNNGERVGKSTVNLGLFDTLSTNMAVYNLKVVLPYYVKSTIELENGGTEESLNDFSIYENLATLNIGYVAGVNNGVIYNCEVYSNANAKSIEDTSKVDNYITTAIGDSYDEFTSKTSTQTTFNIGGIAGINDTTGFITNSRSYIIARLDRGNVGGLVANNQNKIASSYYKAPNVYKNNDNNESHIVLSNNPTTEENSSIAGFVAINSGEIRTSYTEGYNDTTANNDYRYTNGYIQSSIITSGFVSNNSGTIIDCYSNIPVYGTAQTSGFVFTNSGTITRSVSMSKLTEKHSDHTPFIGTKNSGKEIQNSGTVIDSYYLDNNYYSSSLLAVSGVNKIDTKGKTINKSNFNTLTFESANGAKDGIWTIKDDMLSLFDANDIESRHMTQNGTEAYDNYVKYNWTNIDADNNQIASYIISSVDDYNAYFKDGGLLDENNNFKYKVRFVRDVEFSKNDKPLTYDIKLNGADIQGNGMQLTGIYLPGDTIFTTGNTTSLIDNFGLFSEIINSKVKDVYLSTNRLYANNSKNVGVFAGSIENSKITDITIKTGETVLQGINFVGGLAGTIKSSVVTMIDVQAKINANYTNKADTINNAHMYKDVDNTSSSYKYSYAGAVAGRVLTQETTQDTIKSTLKNINVSGNTILLGYYVGGVAGYLDNQSEITYANVDVNENAYIQARFIGGGVVAHNKGVVTKSQVIGTSETYFKGSPNIVGGIVGLNEVITQNNSGKIETCFITLPIINSKVLIAGGIIGVSLGADLQNCIVNNSIQSYGRVGGLIGSIADKNSMGENNEASAWFASYFPDDTTTENQTANNETYNKDVVMDNCIVYLNGINVMDSSAVSPIAGTISQNAKIKGNADESSPKLYVIVSGSYQQVNIETGSFKYSGGISMGEDDPSFDLPTKIERTYTSGAKIIELRTYSGKTQGVIPDNSYVSAIKSRTFKTTHISANSSGDELLLDVVLQLPTNISGYDSIAKSNLKITLNYNV